MISKLAAAGYLPHHADAGRMRILPAAWARRDRYGHTRSGHAERYRPAGLHRLSS